MFNNAFATLRSSKQCTASAKFNLKLIIFEHASLREALLIYIYRLLAVIWCFFMIFIDLSTFDCRLMYFSWFSSIYQLLIVIWCLFHDFHQFIDFWLSFDVFFMIFIDLSIFGSKSQNLEIRFFQNLKIWKYFFKISKISKIWKVKIWK